MLKARNLRNTHMTGRAESSLSVPEQCLDRERQERDDSIMSPA